MSKTLGQLARENSAESIAKRDHDIDLALQNAKDTIRRAILNESTSSIQKYVILNFSDLLGIPMTTAETEKFIRDLIKYFKTEEIDIVHSNRNIKATWFPNEKV